MVSKKNNRRSPVVQQKADPNMQIVVASTSPQQPAQMPRNMRAYIQEGYRSSKTVFRVVGHIARAGSGIKWKHYTDQSKEREIPVDKSELLKLWNNPSPRVGGTAFREAMIAYYCMTGNNYLVGINANNNPTAKFDELYNLRPDLTKIKVDDDGPVYYEYGNFSPPKRYADPFVMHNKLFAGNDDVYGLSPVEVASLLIDIQKAGQKWNLGLMSNMARPGGAWVTDALLGDTEYKGLKDEIRKKFAGPRNAGETAILHGGVKWQSMSMSPYELDWLESDTKGDRDIAGIFFNFPLFLLGLADSTYQNQSEAKHALYTEIVFPLLDMFRDSLNIWLTSRYGGYLDYDQEDVETIQERIQADKAAASDRAAGEFTGGTTTFMEAREIQGKPSLPVKDFVVLQGVPVHVEDLDEYIAAMAGKTISPPAPPPQLLPPVLTTTVTEEPNDQDTGDDEDEPEPAPVKRLSPLIRPALLYRRRTKALDLETTEQKEAYFKSVDTRREKWEAEISTRLQGYFKSEQKTISAAIGRSDDADSAQDRVSHALAVIAQQGTLKHLIVSLYQDVGTDSGDQMLNDLKCGQGSYSRKDDAQSVNLYAPDVLIYLLSLAGEKVSQISDTTQAEIQSALEEGVQAGESIITLAKRIDDLYLLRFIPNRSTVIAATEVHSAMEYGTAQAGQAAQAMGLILKKVWLATPDNHTRPDHRDADGQEVDLDEPFDVGGEALQYPGDPNGSAKNIIRCRCTHYMKRIKATEAEPVKSEDPNYMDLNDYIKNTFPETTTVTRERYRELLRIKS